MKRTTFAIPLVWILLSALPCFADPTRVDTNGVTGLYPAMATLWDNNPAIAYYSAADSAIRFVASSRIDGNSVNGTALDGELTWNAPQTLAALGPASAPTNGVGLVWTENATGERFAVATYSSDGSLFALAGKATGGGNGTSWEWPLGPTYIPGTSGGSGYCRALETCARQVSSAETVPAIAYYDSASMGQLKFRTALDANGTAWNAAVTVDAATQVDAGDGARCDVEYVAGPNGYAAAVAYYDVTDGDLKYVAATDGNWTSWGNGSSWRAPVTIDSAGDVGQYASLIQPGSAGPVISYYDAANGDLMFVAATDANATSWHAPERVVSAGDVGRYSSVEYLGWTGEKYEIGISYYDATNGDLMYIAGSSPGFSWNATSWGSATTWGEPIALLSVGDAGRYVTSATRLSRKGRGFPVFAAPDVSSGDLVYGERPLLDLPPEILTETVPTGTELLSYDFQLQASNGVPPYTWSLLHAVAIRAWGANWSGQATIPDGLIDAVAVAGGQAHGLALRSDGTVLGWGDDADGQASVPAGLGGVVAIAAGSVHSLALRSDGTVVGWGANTEGQASAPVGLGGVAAIAGGGSHSLALRSDGTVTAWGINWDGQATVPPGLSNVAAIAGGGSHSLALRSDGTVAAWGANWDGQATVPPGLSNVVAVAGGGSHSVALKSDGTVVAWGANWDGQATVPPGLSNVVAIACGGSHSLAVRSDGTVVGWGADWSAQVTVPAGLGNVLAVACGWSFSLALLDPGLFPPGGLAFSTGGVLGGIPAAAGTGTVTFVVCDADGESALRTLQVRVDANLNTRPVITSNTPPAGVFEIAIETSQVFRVWAYDPDGSNLVYHWTWDGLEVGTDSNEYRLVTTLSDSGTHVLRCCASDDLWTNQVYREWRVNLLTDSDGDGMADAWEYSYFGTLSRDGTGDHDGDGVSDLNEHLLNTNPTVWPVAILTDSLPGGVERVPYGTQLRASNGLPPYAWSLRSPGYGESGTSSTFSAVGTAQDWRADDNCWTWAVPFAFPFYGATKTVLYISSNGTIAFDDIFSGYTPSVEVLKSRQMIAVLWKDLRTDMTGSDIHVESTTNAVTVRWAATYFSGGTAVNAAVTLTPDGRVSLAYGEGNSDGGMIGISAGDGERYTLSVHSESGSMHYADNVLFAEAPVLPDGLSCSPDGRLSGTPTAAATSTVTVVVQDADGAVTNQVLDFVILAATYTNGYDLPDQWLDLYDWGRLPEGPRNLRDADEDADVDGMTNGDEMFAGTDPTDTDSRLLVLPPLPPQAQQWLLRFESVPGRQYRMQRCTNLLESFENLGSVVNATNHITEYQLDLPPAERLGYFRVRVLP